MNKIIQFTLVDITDIRFAITGTKLDKCSSVIIVTFFTSSSSIFVQVLVTIFSILSDCVKSCNFLGDFSDTLDFLFVRIILSFLPSIPILLICRVSKIPKLYYYRSVNKSSIVASNNFFLHCLNLLAIYPS